MLLDRTPQRRIGCVVDDKAKEHQPNCIFHTHHMVDELLQRFAALVAAAERQRIADLLMKQHEQARERHNYWQVAAEWIQVGSDT